MSMPRGKKQKLRTDEAGSARETWPVLVIDALGALQAADPSFPRRRSSLFQPLLTPHAFASAEKSSDKSPQAELHESALVENEPGLCEQMERAHADLRLQYDVFCAAWRIRDGRNAQRTEAPHLPPLASLVRQQLRGARRRLRMVLLRRAGACCNESSRDGDGVGGGCVCDACAGARTLTAPLLFGSLVRNDLAHHVRLWALGCDWLVPRHCAFSLSLLEGWRKLARSSLMPPGGFQLILLDPPWPSRSVRRAGTYETATLPQLAAQLPLPELCDQRGCLLAIWITNDAKVLAFVENVLLPQWGARTVGMWYWLKVAADGQLAVGSMRSPHRKPWEPLLLAMVGGHPPGRAGSGSPPTSPAAAPMPPPPLPARRVLCTVPTGGHSAKPTIDALLRPAAAHLLGLGRGAQQREKMASPPVESAAECGAEHKVRNDKATLPAPGCGAGDDEAEELAWRELRKCELFARELRPFWHSLGDEVLRFQHCGWFENEGLDDNRGA